MTRGRVTDLLRRRIVVAPMGPGYRSAAEQPAGEIIERLGA